MIDGFGGAIEIIVKVFDAFPWWLNAGLFLVLIAKLFRKRIRKIPNVISSYYKLKTLKRFINDPVQQFMYLRAVNHFVFEEMILSAFKKLGYKIKRNTRYTGDGGIDGRIFINKKLYLIQAKRYKSYISAKDVQEFSHICRKHRCKGLFIHTGKTGKMARTLISNNVDIVSGQRMLNLLMSIEFKNKILLN